MRELSAIPPRPAYLLGEESHIRSLAFIRVNLCAFNHIDQVLVASERAHEFGHIWINWDAQAGIVLGLRNTA